MNGPQSSDPPNSGEPRLDIDKALTWLRQIGLPHENLEPEHSIRSIDYGRFCQLHGLDGNDGAIKELYDRLHATRITHLTNLSTRAVNGLHGAGNKSLLDVMMLSEDEIILEVRKVGRATARNIVDSLTEFGLVLAPEESL